MRILFVAPTESIHSARWIHTIARPDWELHVFPSNDTGIVHPALRHVKVHHAAYLSGMADSSVQEMGAAYPSRVLLAIAKRIYRRVKGLQEGRLATLIGEMHFDVVHSLEFQHAGRLTLAAKSLQKSRFPPWIATNWGADISYFGRFPAQAQVVRQILAECDCYSCECERDVDLAVKFGFRGKLLPVLPNAGGFDLAQAYDAALPGLISHRKTIAIKGYDGWAGRGLVAIEALRRCGDLLGDLEIAIYSAPKRVVRAAVRLGEEFGCRVTAVPGRQLRLWGPDVAGFNHQDMLRLHGRSRVSLGLSVADGISTSLLEAIVMGSFPIQSDTGCAAEWLIDGESGFIVPPEDPQAVAIALRRALTDDKLVNEGARRNQEIARTRLDITILRQEAQEYYRIASAAKSPSQ